MLSPASCAVSSPDTASVPLSSLHVAATSAPSPSAERRRIDQRVNMYMSCTSGDWLTSRPKGCLQPRELWFFDILM